MHINEFKACMKASVHVVLGGKVLFSLEKQKEIFIYEQRFVENIVNHFGYLKSVHCFSICSRIK